MPSAASEATSASPSGRPAWPSRPASAEADDQLRCLIVTPVLDAGGIDEFVAFLARNLPRQGVAATVLCVAPSGKDGARTGHLAQVLRSEGLTIAAAGPADGPGCLSLSRPGVISAHGPPDWVLQAADTLKIPIVETLHAVPTPIGTRWDREPQRSRFITAFVAVSEIVRRQYLRGNPAYQPDAVVTIPNAFNKTSRAAVDRGLARAWLGLTDEFIFLSLARHVLQKNAYGLVAAFADVARRNPQAHLVIAGRVDDQPYTEEVRRLRDALPARTQIHLRGNLSEPSALLAAADGFVLNSFFEGWPLASMEALAAGLPVVMSDVGGAREQVGTDGVRGFVVPSPLGDPDTASWEAAGQQRFRPQANKDALASAMDHIIRDRDRWAEQRGQLAAAAANRFSVDACAAQHAALLRRAAAGAIDRPC